MTLEGATVQYGKDIDGKQKSGFEAVVGWYAIDEARAESDSYLFAAQGAYKGKVSDMGFDLGVGYYNFVHFDLDNTDDADGDPKLGFEPDFDYTGKDFNIVEFFGSIGGDDITENVPWKLYGQHAFNTASHDNNVNITDSERDAYLI